MATHVYNLDKTELKSFAQKAKQVSDNQGKMCYNKTFSWNLEWK